MKSIERISVVLKLCVSVEDFDELSLSECFNMKLEHFPNFNAQKKKKICIFIQMCIICITTEYIFM